MSVRKVYNTKYVKRVVRGLKSKDIMAKRNKNKTSDSRPSATQKSKRE